MRVRARVGVRVGVRLRLRLRLRADRLARSGPSAEQNQEVADDGGGVVGARRGLLAAPTQPTPLEGGGVERVDVG